MNKQQLIGSDKSDHTMPEASNNLSINVGLSACLAGHNVRYNGGHTQSKLCLGVLSQHVNFKTFCPEVAAGFGTPRPTMRLIGDPKEPRLVFSDRDDVDLSAQLKAGFEPQLAAMNDLDGYILMKNSPSCGLERIKVYQPNGHPHTLRTAGLFADALQKTYPLMPIEEEGRLHDSRLFENFIIRVYAHNHYRKEVIEQPSIHNLTQFHSSYKFLLMAHDQKKKRDLGQLLAHHSQFDLDQLIQDYFSLFMETLKKPASKKNHANTLLHLLGYIKHATPSAARQHIVSVIKKYKEGLTPLSTPLTLITHYLSQHGSDYINTQRYLNPYPENMNPIRNYC